MNIIQEEITPENCNEIVNEFAEKEKRFLNYSQGAAWNVVFWYLQQRGDEVV